MKHIQKYFTSGLLFLIPIWILYAVVKGIAGLITDIVQLNFIIAFAGAVLGITVFGFLLGHVFKRYLKTHVDTWSQQNNLWGLVCRTIGQFDSLSDKARAAFHNPVLYQVDDGIYKLGFITDHDQEILHYKDNDEETDGPARDSVWVYAPYPITLTGELIPVEDRKIKKLSTKDNESIPLFIMTAGLLEKK